MLHTLIVDTQQLDGGLLQQECRRANGARVTLGTILREGK